MRPRSFWLVTETVSHSQFLAFFSLFLAFIVLHSPRFVVCWLFSCFSFLFLCISVCWWTQLAVSVGAWIQMQASLELFQASARWSVLCLFCREHLDWHRFFLLVYLMLGSLRSDYRHLGLLNYDCFNCLNVIIHCSSKIDVDSWTFDFSAKTPFLSPRYRSKESSNPKNPSIKVLFLFEVSTIAIARSAYLSSVQENCGMIALGWFLFCAVSQALDVLAQKALHKSFIFHWRISSSNGMLLALRDHSEKLRDEKAVFSRFLLILMWFMWFEQCWINLTALH